MNDVAGVHAASTGPSNELFSVDFFDLQLRFAKRVSELSAVPFLQTVGSHTNLYVRLGMGQRLDPNNPDWRGYLAGLATANRLAEWTHAIHVRRLKLPVGPAPTGVSGCFSYTLIDADRARLHFHAGACASGSPLEKANLSARQKELDALVIGLGASSSESMQVVGASWLYNLAPYRSLFPEPYLASLRSIAHPYQRMPLWGQFLMRDRTVRSAVKARFINDLGQASTLSALEACFPLSVLATASSIERFMEGADLRNRS